MTDSAPCHSTDLDGKSGRKVLMLLLLILPLLIRDSYLHLGVLEVMYEVFSLLRRR